MINELNYFSLVRKSDNVEVYSSPEYFREDGNSFDFQKIAKNLNYYFERVNGGIQQQIESPKLSDEQKKNLKFLDINEYVIKYAKLKELGCFQKIYWTKEASDILKNN